MAPEKPTTPPPGFTPKFIESLKPGEAPYDLVWCQNSAGADRPAATGAQVHRASARPASRTRAGVAGHDW